VARRGGVGNSSGGGDKSYQTRNVGMLRAAWHGEKHAARALLFGGDVSDVDDASRHQR